MDAVAWPLTTRTLTTLAFPLIPEAYFRLQGQERQWKVKLIQWFRLKGILPPEVRVHGLILMASSTAVGMLGGYLVIEKPEQSPPHAFWHLLPIELTEAVMAVSEQLQQMILAERE